MEKSPKPGKVRWKKSGPTEKVRNGPCVYSNFPKSHDELSPHSFGPFRGHRPEKGRWYLFRLFGPFVTPFTLFYEDSIHFNFCVYWIEIDNIPLGTLDRNT